MKKMSTQQQDQIQQLRLKTERQAFIKSEARPAIKLMTTWIRNEYTV